MSKKTPETSRIADQLYELDEALKALVNKINYGPDLNRKEAKQFTALLRVQKLVELAWEIYPYYGIE